MSLGRISILERPRAPVYDFDIRDDGRLYRLAGGSYFSAVIRNNIAIYVRTAEPIFGSLLRNAWSRFNLEGTGTRRIRPDSLWFRGILRVFAISSSDYLFHDRGYLSEISYKPIFVADIYRKMEGFAISGFIFWNFSNLFENKRASFHFVLEYF